jgi:pyruvate formate lyase activating enzyme
LKAISHADDRFICIDRKLCDLCGLCVEACPPQAIVFDSKEMTVREVVDELLKDIEFYGPSGGITLSGGDPFSQKEFTLELLKECKKHGLNTAIETCLYVDRKTLEQFLPYIDLLIADFKVFDSELHNLYTGQDNTMIKDNFVYLFNHYFEQDKLDVLVRIPLIPEYTATEENLKEIARFLYSLSPRVRVELLNYNPLAQSKYTLMNKKFIYEKNPEMYKNDELEVYNGILASEGIMNIARE